jgi:uncharacterized membrane protein YagU involved in acid resistance
VSHTLANLLRISLFKGVPFYDVNFLVLLHFSILMSFGFHLIENTYRRKWYSLVCGLFVMNEHYGLGVMTMPLSMGIGAYFILKYYSDKKTVHKVAIGYICLHYLAQTLYRLMYND